MTSDRIWFCLRCVRAALVTVCACKSLQLQVSDNEAGAATGVLMSGRLRDLQPYGTYNRVLPRRDGGSFSSRCYCSPITLRQHACYLIYISGHNWRWITAACFPSCVRIPDARRKAVRKKEIHWSQTNIGVLSCWNRDGFLLLFSLCKLRCWMVCYWGVSVTSLLAL